jgi:hypothetical protein
VAKDVGKETNVEPPLGKMECLVTEFVEGQVFKWRGHECRVPNTNMHPTRAGLIELNQTKAETNSGDATET